MSLETLEFWFTRQSLHWGSELDKSPKELFPFKIKDIMAEIGFRIGFSQ